MPNRNFLLLLTTLVISYACYVRAEQNPYARYVAAGYSVINRWSLQDTPDQLLFEGAMRGMVSVLDAMGDEHSAFFNEQQRQGFREDLTQQFGGVGVRIRLLGEPKLPTIIGPPEPGTPAYHADIRSGDVIMAIEGKSTSEMPMQEILRLMRGLVGDPLVLTIRHLGEDQSQDIQLVREMITIDSVYGDLHGEKGEWIFRLAEDSRIGYVRITQFGDKTVAELTRVLADLTNGKNSPPIKALILDVRDNHGGALDAAVSISDMFLRAGQTIVTTRGRDKIARDRFVATGHGNYTKIPIVVLINQESASASEILAASLQDYGRAVIIGQRTYGKGTVQRLFSHVESGRSVLKLTTATYWRPSGQNIHRMPGDNGQDTWGVKPNPEFEVVLDEEEYIQWRKYRSRRDLLGEKTNGDLYNQLNEQDGAVPDSFTDRVLQRAVSFLQSAVDSRL